MQIRELISTCLERNLPFFCYRKPGCSIGMGIQTSPLHPQIQPVDIKTAHGFVVAPFRTDDAYYVVKEDLKVDTQDVEIEKTDLPILPCPTTTETEGKHEIGREAYTKKVAAAISKIKQGELAKVVYSHPQFIEGDYINQATTIFNKLTKAYTQAYVAMVHLPGQGLWMCATPELLLSRKGQDLQTIALAGTRSLQVHGTPWDNKNKEEQQIVERYIVKTLQPFCTSINVTPVTTTQAGHLEHLLTRIGMKMPVQQPTEQLLAALHPTPAVCGQPKEASYNDILENEGYERQLYSGFVGYVENAEDFALYVNLRCMKLTKEGATLFAGGGITADSDPTSEWEETKMKIETLKRFLE